MGKVTELGHVGIGVTDLEKMTDFYTRVLGMTITDDIPGRGVFLSARPTVEHHELLLTQGAPPANAQQISFTVDSLDDLRELYHAIRDYGCSDFHITNHGIALGCYFKDPEDNYVEIYWSTGVDYPQPHSEAIDLDASNEELLVAFADMPQVPGSEKHYYGRDAGKRILSENLAYDLWHRHRR